MEQGKTTEAEAAPARQVVVRGRGEGFAQQITAGRHTLHADEPLSSGGTGTGPDPYALLLASLGACTSMTLAMYARRKHWPLESVTVTLSHARVHAADCEGCETQAASLERIERRIELQGALDADQRARLVEIAEKCPVHRTLTSQIEIRTELA
jgi:putative redox protein